MSAIRKLAALFITTCLMCLACNAALAADPRVILRDWYKLSLELVRHTPTYSPPVASRAFAYLGVTAFEATASGDDNLQSLANQLNSLVPLPRRTAGETYDEAVVMQAAMADVAQMLFANTGPTGQRALQKMAEKRRADVSHGVSADVVARSESHGRAIAAHVLDWAADDGGAVIENLGFPLVYDLPRGPAHWTPTSLIALQQKPLLPSWGANRTFAMPTGATCPLPPPPVYSEAKDSAFYAEALNVYNVKKTLSPEQRAVARFWSDDPMLSPTPPGHWQSIALQILERDNADLATHVDVLARLGVAMADAFIGCWHVKYQYDLLRPVTYIKRLMDPKWESALTTPPFPEYPSGHSVQSAAAAVVLTDIFGGNFEFEDATHVKDSLEPRKFANFWAAAEEAGISRFYGGIHFRSAITRGLDQGRCIGAYAVALRTRK